MNFLPENDASKKERFSKPALVMLSTSAFLLQSLPALAEKIEQTMSAPSKPPNTALLGFFTIVNYVAGLAILAALVFGAIWFFQKRNDGEEDVVDAEGATVSESTTETESKSQADAEAKPAADAETKAETGSENSDSKPAQQAKENA
ncbi:MAG: hypothetical protein JSS83_21635 [Cyanobacteria bacterium SZAS LIN-3]|nr:hypothetical protein [Cyanobacteria bacterium SZAS LIN-3]